jgi:hypothetical protein
VIKNNVYALLKDNAICDLTEKENTKFNNRKYALNKELLTEGA